MISTLSVFYHTLVILDGHSALAVRLFIELSIFFTTNFFTLQNYNKQLKILDLKYPRRLKQDYWEK